MTTETTIAVEIDEDALYIDDLKTLETGEGMHELLLRVISEVKIDDEIIPVGRVPLRYLFSIGEAIGETIKGLANPNA